MSSVGAESPSKRELAWREYQLSVDLYKFYVELVVKVIVAYYAITGGILSFYFAQTTRPYARWALALPALLSFGLAAIFRWGVALWQIVRDDAFDLAAELGLKAGFELSVLNYLLNGAAILLALSGIAMATLIVVNP